MWVWSVVNRSYLGSCYELEHIRVWIKHFKFQFQTFGQFLNAVFSLCSHNFTVKTPDE